MKKGSDVTFIGSDNQLAYGTIGIVNKKIVNFERNITFKFKNKYNKKIISYVYSGMSIFNKKLLSLKFNNLKNFEKQLYPLIIRKFKCDFKIFNGFWHSIDNLKDIDNIQMINNKNKYLKLKKLITKING